MASTGTLATVEKMTKFFAIFSSVPVPVGGSQFLFRFRSKGRSAAALPYILLGDFEVPGGMPTVDEILERTFVMWFFRELLGCTWS